MSHEGAGERQDRRNFFMSYTAKDQQWAEWIAWQLEEAGYTLFIEAWDSRPGSNFVAEMEQAAQSAEQTLLVLSPTYLLSDDTFAQWAVAFRHDPKGTDRRLLPVRVELCEVEGFLGQLAFIDLVSLEEAQARERLLTGVQQGRTKPATVAFPGHTTSPVAFPGSVPMFWNVPYLRNPHFTGREELLELLDQHLTPAVPDHLHPLRSVALTQPQAITGLGGIGKTQIAVEYAYRSRHLGRYRHILWINAANSEKIIESFIGLAADVLPASVVQGETNPIKLAAAVKRWLEQCEQPWLLVFDNVDDPAMIDTYLPRGGNGSILLTTRAHAVGSLATSVEVETMGFLEGSHLLLRRAQRSENASDEEINQAGNIVIALDHFPLALDQAGAYIEETQCSFTAYLDLYQTHHQTLLARRGSLSIDYPDSVATTWLLSFQKVQQANPAAAELLELCSFLAPDRIPEELLRKGADYWPASLRQATADPLLFQQLMAELLKFSLVKRLAESQALSIHRLVQAVQRDRIAPEAQRQWAKNVVRAVNQVFPGNPNDRTTWHQCLSYLDQVQTCHLLIEHYLLSFLDAADLLHRTGIYLTHQSLYTFAEPLRQRALHIWEQQVGADHPQIAFPLNGLAVLYTEQGRYAEAEPLYQRALHILEQNPQPEHLQVDILNNLGSLYKQLGKYAEAELFYQRAREQCLGEEHPLMANILNNLANLYAEQGKYTEAESLYQQALHILEQDLGEEHSLMADLLDNLANLYAEQGKYTEAEPLYQRALQLKVQNLGEEHALVADTLNNIAVLSAKQSKYAEAEPLYQRALYIRKQRLGEEHPLVANTLNNIAVLYAKQSNYAEAEPLYQRALHIWEQQSGVEHPDVISALNGLAALYAEQDKYAEAESLYQRALSIRKEHLGEEHPLVADLLNNLANLYEKQGRHTRAEPLYQRALHILEQRQGPEYLQVEILNNLGSLYQNEGKPTNAEALYQRAVHILEQRQGPESPQLAFPLNNLANLYAEQGKYVEAEPLYQRALYLKEQSLGMEHPQRASTLNNLANLYQKQGRYAEAELLYQQAFHILKHSLGAEHPLTQKISKNYTSLVQKMDRKNKWKNWKRVVTSFFHSP